MITISNLDFQYQSEAFHLHIDELKIDEGKSTAIIGPSGCGKTTLLYLISGICQPQLGKIKLGDTELTKESMNHLRERRSREMGFVFQEFELLDYLSVRENILLNRFLNPRAASKSADEKKLQELAQNLGVENLLNRYPQTLSQGEKQRTAICRAMLHKPKIVIADEPTGNLDPVNTKIILNLLLEQTKQIGATLVMVTHDHSLLPHFDCVVDFTNFIGTP